MTYNANQHRNEVPLTPSTDAGDDDHSMTTSSGSFEETYSPYENTSRQLSPISDTSFATFDYSFPFCNYSEGRPGEIGGQINITQNVYTHDGSLNHELLIPRNTRLPSHEISSPELFNTWPISETDYYVSQTETLSPCSIPESSNYQLAPSNNSNKGDEGEKEPKKRKSGRNPQICQLDDCNKHFRRSAELTRHQGSVHREKLKKKPVLIPCSYPGCSRSGENGFKRRDNYMQHLRGPHNEVIPKRKRGRGVQQIPYVPDIGIPRWPLDQFEY